MKDAALVVVDMIYDFIDGSLACHGAEDAVEKTVKFIEETIGESEHNEEVIYGTFPILFVRDFHPSDHCSFKEQGGIWPPHCVQGTHGADVHEKLQPYATEELTFFKGFRKDQEQYSGFEAVSEADQTLGDVLDTLDIHNVFLCGIATEYCVRETCRDLSAAGYKVRLLKDCLAYVDREGHEKALQEMEKEGIKLI